MKKHLCNLLTLLTIVLLAQLPARGQDGKSTALTYQHFYDELASYGTWIEYPDYGHVWHPDLDEDFRPYATNGHWVYTDSGWYWMSGYPFGWATFHYGRWIYDSLMGWLWIPGSEWSPAWVVWGTVNGFYAWAPLPPEAPTDGVDSHNWRPHPYYWNMVRKDQLYNRDLSSVLVGMDTVRREVGGVSQAGTYRRSEADGSFYSTGPDIKEVEGVTHHIINPLELRDVDMGLHNVREGNILQVYRPFVIDPTPARYRKAIEVSPLVSPEDWPMGVQRNQSENIRTMRLYETNIPFRINIGRPKQPEKSE